MKRRSFLKTVGQTAGASALAHNGLSAARAKAGPPEEVVDGMPRRAIGKDGDMISVIGYPGLALTRGEQPECNDALHRAFDRGINYYDVAPAYGKGEAEIKMGIGLQGLDRDSIFLACKTKMRDKDGAREELERSLERLKTDRFDLYQLHCLIKPEEVDEVFGPGGAMETIFKAKQEGKIRNIGFSAHTTKAALAAMKRFRFDSVMFPINYVEYFIFGFGKPIVELAEEQGTAVLAIKTISAGDWQGEMKTDRSKRPRNSWYRPLEEQSDIDLAVRFTLSQKAVVSGIPVAWLDLADKTFEGGRNYRPITDREMEKLRGMAEKSASMFLARQQVACHERWDQMHEFDSPHEGCPGEMA